MDFCHTVARLLLAASLLTWIGCGNSSAEGTNRIDFSVLRKMAEMHEAYQREHNNEPPKDEADFRRYLESKQSELAGLTVDEMFVSPRNGKPLKWSYGKLPVSPMGIRLLAYETEPTDGKRLVIGRGSIEVLDDARFRKMYPSIK
jgi:hypothetical protein